MDFSQTLSIVGLVGNTGEGNLIAEARFVRERNRPYAEVAFVVDEEYQGLGMATYLFKRLIQLAKKQGVIPSAVAALRALKSAGLYLDDDVIRVALREAVGEAW